ncbi:hypothetical protein ACIBVL_12895 [Streptomyces sp. NPDC049687]|uniref:hypothetical protein n=1 Tax=Streptomyces sp. NPDC049687 TaxID=3365596 RepID=UPI0037AEC8E5
MTQTRHEKPVNSIRIVSPYNGDFALVAHISWSEGDPSLYIRPYFEEGWKARAVIFDAPPNASTTVTQQYQCEVDPGEAKLSLHYSGQCHVYYGKGKTNRTPPVYGPKLNDAAGGHIASINCFDLHGLPLLGGPPRQTGPELDVVAPAPGQGTAQLKVSLHASSDEQAMQNFPLWLTLKRPVMPDPLYVALQSRSEQGPMKPIRGVQVVGGWGPGAQHDAPIRTLALWTGPDNPEAPYEPAE